MSYEIDDGDGKFQMGVILFFEKMFRCVVVDCLIEENVTACYFWPIRRDYSNVSNLDFLVVIKL